MADSRVGIVVWNRRAVRLGVAPRVGVLRLLLRQRASSQNLSREFTQINADQKFPKATSDTRLSVFILRLSYGLTGFLGTAFGMSSVSTGSSSFADPPRSTGAAIFVT